MMREEVTFGTCILKVTSFCNLDCSYCYMFNKDDQTYKIVPKYLDIATLNAVLDLCEQSADRREGNFCLVLHGGEPTLWPIESFRYLGERVAEIQNRHSGFEVSLQTNLLRPLPDALVECLRMMHCRIGVSCDGPARWNDQHRYDHAGRGSYNRIMNNIAKLERDGDGDLIGGFLCVANPDIEPLVFFDWIQQLPVKRLDILWPIDFYQESPPWADGQQDAYVRQPRYGRWMSDLYALWWERDDPEIDIRQFRSTLSVRLGAAGHIDSLVNDRLDMFVVNTDGRIEYPDYLRATPAGSRATQLNIRTCSLEDIAADRIYAQLFELRAHLPLACHHCRHRRLCGGGFLPGRASVLQPISNERSVLCADQYHYFSTVERLLQQAMTTGNQDVRREAL